MIFGVQKELSVLIFQAVEAAAWHGSGDNTSDSLVKTEQQLLVTVHSEVAVHGSAAGHHK